MPEKVFPFDQHTSTGEYDVGHSGYLDALKHGVVDPHVMGFGADGVLAFRVEDNQVGVAAYGNCALSWIQPEQFGGRGGDQFDETVYVEASLCDSAGVHQAHPMLDSR